MDGMPYLPPLYKNYNYTLFCVIVCCCSYEALESDEEKGSDNESDVSTRKYVRHLVISAVL